MKLNLESRIRCSDETKLRLIDVIIEPVNRTVSHVVVSTVADDAPHRLVPVDELNDSAELGLRVGCRVSDLDSFPVVSRSDFIAAGSAPIAEPGWAVGVTAPLALPYFYSNFNEPWPHDTPAVTWDQIPAGEVEIRRNSVVTSADGIEAGHVDGFVCNDTGSITHVVLQHGNAFGREDLAIPVGEVDRFVNDGVMVKLTADEIEELPGVSVHRWHHPR